MQNAVSVFTGVLGVTVIFMGSVIHQNIEYHTPSDRKELTSVVQNPPPKSVSKDDLVVAEGYEFVKKTCTLCHSHTLITKLRKDREGWQDLLIWMKNKQGLRELTPKEEKVVLDYLVNNYGPENSSANKSVVLEYGKYAPVYRRPPLSNNLMPSKR